MTGPRARIKRPLTPVRVLRARLVTGKGYGTRKLRGPEAA
jgi:hypothetical protein